MKIEAINPNFRNYEIARLKNDTPIEKPVPKTCSRDVFVKGNISREVSFDGSLGGTVGAVGGELLALGATKCPFVPQSLLWTAIIFAGLCASFGLFGSWAEDKINQKRENKNQDIK